MEERAGDTPDRQTTVLMTDHPTTEKLQDFRRRTLGSAELLLVAQHLSDCQLCQRQFAAIFEQTTGGEGFRLSLAPVAGLEHEHLESQQIRAYLDSALERDERQMLDAHMAVCAECRREVRSLAEWDRKLTPRLRQAETEHRQRGGWWSDFLNALAAYAGWRPLQVAGAALACGVIIFAAFLLFRHPTNVPELAKLPPPVGVAQAPAPAPTATPEALSGEGSAPGVEPAPHEQAERAERPRRVDEAREERHAERSVAPTPPRRDAPPNGAENGTTAETESLPASLRAAYVAALRGDELERPAVLDEISNPATSLRGNVEERATLKLLSPGRGVLVSDRPTFRWERLEGATSYQVQVFDPRFVAVAKSEVLSANTTSWTLTTPLQRGVVYRWIINAEVGGETMTWPAASAPEMKFKILSGEKLAVLNRLRGSSAPRLALGLFYAREGMLSEAESELESLIAQDPDSTAARKLLHSVRSWR